MVSGRGEWEAVGGWESECAEGLLGCEGELVADVAREGGKGWVVGGGDGGDGGEEGQYVAAGRVQWVREGEAVVMRQGGLAWWFGGRHERLIVESRVLQS